MMTNYPYLAKASRSLPNISENKKIPEIIFELFPTLLWNVNVSLFYISFKG